MDYVSAPEYEQLGDGLETVTTGVHVKVEYLFHNKARFGLKKVRYQGLAKNTAQSIVLFGLVILMTAKVRPGCLGNSSSAVR